MHVRPGQKIPKNFKLSLFVNDILSVLHLTSSSFGGGRSSIKKVNKHRIGKKITPTSAGIQNSLIQLLINDLPIVLMIAYEIMNDMHIPQLKTSDVLGTCKFHIF